MTAGDFFIQWFFPVWMVFFLILILVALAILIYKSIHEKEEEEQ